MFLYNLTLQKATGITRAVQGSFSGTRHLEIAVSRGKVLELLRLDSYTGKVYTLLTVEVFGVIRSMVGFKLTGGSKDCLAIGSDSGQVVILEYNNQKNIFEKIYREKYSKTGCRRKVPGHFIAADPRGRAVMIGAIEEVKLAYSLNRDTVGRWMASSPIADHKFNTILYDMVGVDVGFKNPMFACLEVDVKETDDDMTGMTGQIVCQTLAFYELDFGLSSVVRKYNLPLEEHGNCLISVPGGNDGPGGVLICLENYIMYKNYGSQRDIRCPIPRRRNDLDNPDRGVIFVCSTTHRTKSMFFFLAQTEQGDIFKINLETDENKVTEIKLKYLDTMPVASAMCILKTGYLFVASEFGNHFLYHVAFLGDDDGEPEFSSNIPVEEGNVILFTPRLQRNLILMDELDSLSPIMHCEIADLTHEDNPQWYVACGRGPQSSLRVLRHGLEVSEMGVSELPGTPNGVWTIKKRADDDFDDYIIVSFIDATLVLSVGETIDEVTNSFFSAFLSGTSTLACAQIGEDALVQIHPEGIQHIKADRVNEWRNQDEKTITKCAVNQRQIVIALTGGSLVYFEVDAMGQLCEYTDKKDFQSEVVCMALASVPRGEQRSRFLAVGLMDNTVRIISLDPSDYLSCLSVQSLPDKPESLAIVEMNIGSERGDQKTLHLNIGLQSGVLLRTVLDQRTGNLSNTQTRYLGSEPVKLYKVRIQGTDALVAMSSQSWLSYYYQNQFHLAPLSCEPLECACGLSSEQCPEGILAVSSNTLRIMSLEKLGAAFTQVTIPLEYTPRKFVVDPESHYLIIIETDHNAYTDKTKELRKQNIAKEMLEMAEDHEREFAADMAADVVSENLPEAIFGAPKAGLETWASLIRILDPIDGETIFKVPLEQNNAAFSICLVKFANQGDQQFLLIGVAKSLNLTLLHCNGGSIYTYRVLDEGKKLELVHQTEVKEIPYAICPFQGKVLIGIGKILRMYDMGEKKLLRKCENKDLPSRIVTIHCIESRIIIGCDQESFFYIWYKQQENRLLIFSDDTNPRWLTTACLLDCDTVAGADKLGNVFVIRLPAAISNDLENNSVGEKALWEKDWTGNSSQKAETVTDFHIGEMVTSLQKVTLIPGGSDCLVYATVSGAIGVLVPFISHEDLDFLQSLEMHLQSENPPLCGHDHLSFRSYHFAAKNVVDGDLCEQFNSLAPAKQRLIARDLDCNPNEVLKKLEDVRARYAF